MQPSARSFVRVLSIVASLIMLGASVSSASAQGKSKGRQASGKAHEPPGQAKKHVTTSQAIVVTRDVLVKHGYNVVRVERVGVTEVIYYRRGNNGRGRGLGPVERMVVRPSGDIVVFESAPRGVLVDINVRLGM